MKYQILSSKWFFPFLFCVSFIEGTQAIDRAHTLKIYNFANYIDNDLLEEFPIWYKEQTGEEVKIIHELYDVDEVAIAKIEQGHEDFDVMCCTNCVISRLLERNLLLPIQRNFEKTPDYISHISPFISQQLNRMGCKERQMKDYVAGYMWGTIGLLYNPRRVDEKDMQTWGVLWNEKYRNSILMKDSYLDVYGPVIIYAHYEEILRGELDRNELVLRKSDEDIALVEQLMKEAKPNIIGWEIDFGKEMMTKGKIPINVTFSGDAMWAIKEARSIGVELRYNIPQEASEIWFDGWVIPKYVRNRKAANYFINYLCRSDNVLRNMEETGYVSAIATPEILSAMQDSIEGEITDLSYFFGEGAEKVPVARIRYPDKSTMERCVLLYNAWDKTRDMIEMWSRIKGGNLVLWQKILILTSVSILFLFAFLQKRKNKYRKI